ncbi:response regulator [Alsobacter sp. SYSU M60028]|uniref:Response regulator n=1 Tax=Alsobacter ponti TaxID=2962936 RepID=A0ABT1LC81_9HYPH|nr:response regulator [Alsobacter ponti]MCP8939120.1 response regulator [Alsobacter ponti]
MTVPSAPLLLVVDDEPQIQRFLKPALTAAGYRVTMAATGAEALRLATRLAPAAIILDLGLPDMDGKDVIAALRPASDTPIVVLSARDREAEKIAALDLGANDFVNKPFGIGELLARLRVALRQRPGPLAEPEKLRVGELSLDAATRRVTRGGEPVHLTPTEFDLLALLMRHAGRVMTHRQILSAVWGPAHVNDTQYLRVFVGQLRQKIEREPSAPALILTEPGVGYRFAEDASESERD